MVLFEKYGQLRIPIQAGYPFRDEVGQRSGLFRTFGAVYGAEQRNLRRMNNPSV